MAIEVQVKNYAGTQETKTVTLDQTASEYCKGLRSAGYKGIISKVEEALEAGLTVVIDQFLIEIKQV
jgi:hypothetical protein